MAGFLGQGEAADTSVELGLELLPPDVASALQPAIYEVRNAPHAGLITLGILTTIWASASGLEALRHALNLAYDVGDPPAFWRTRLESLLLTVLAAVVVIVVMILLVVIPLVLQTVQVLFQRTGSTRGIIFAGARESLGFLLLLGLLMLLYRVLPNVALRPTEVVPGAVVAWLLWLGAVWGYTIYLRSVPSYSVTYGSLGGIVVTLFFFYISALLFILRRRGQQRPQAPEREPPALMPRGRCASHFQRRARLLGCAAVRRRGDALEPPPMTVPQPLMQGKKGLDHGHRQRPLPGVGHRQGGPRPGVPRSR